MYKVLRILLLGGGTLSLALGILGVFVPVLPTPPSLLLATFCYARSSQRFYHWITTNRLFGNYIRNYRAGCGILLAHKVVTILFLWVTVKLTAFLAV